MATVQSKDLQIIQDLGFPQPQHVQGRASIADIFRPGKRCGLYVLYFANGEFYAGQAADITRRYVQHRKVHTDIEKISFKQVAEDRLDEEERAAIWALEKNGYSLRNIVFTSIPKGEADFDLVMSVEEQERWLTDTNYVDSRGTRFVEPDLRRKYSAKFQSFSNMPYADGVMEVLRSYVQAGIPAFLRSEVSFWACSCLPGRQNTDFTVYSRVNINWQEVLTIYLMKHTIHVSLHLARSPLEEVDGEGLYRLLQEYSSLVTRHINYKPGGQDQINLDIRGLRHAQSLLLEREVVRAICLFNLRLMKKGPCNFSRYHCLDLADRLVTT